MANGEKIEAVKRQLPGIAVGAAAAVGVGYFGADLPAWAVDTIKQVGPFAVLLLVGFWYVPRSYLKDSIQNGKDQAVALSKLGDAVERMAGQETRLEQIMSESLINQRVMVSRLQRIEDLIIDGRKVPEPRDSVAPAANPARS